MVAYGREVGWMGTRETHPGRTKVRSCGIGILGGMLTDDGIKGEWKMVITFIVSSYDAGCSWSQIGYGHIHALIHAPMSCLLVSISCIMNG